MRAIHDACVTDCWCRNDVPQHPAHTAPAPATAARHRHAAPIAAEAGDREQAGAEQQPRHMVEQREERDHRDRPGVPVLRPPQPRSATTAAATPISSSSAYIRASPPYMIWNGETAISTVAITPTRPAVAHPPREQDQRGDGEHERRQPHHGRSAPAAANGALIR